MGSHFYYWRNQKGGPKQGALVFPEGHLEFDLTNHESFEAARLRLGEAIGEVYKAPLDGQYTGEGRTTSRYIRGKSSPDLLTAIASLREAIGVENAYQKRMTDEPAFALEERIRRHDWTYAYADDHSSWSAGHRNEQEIRRLIPLVPNAREVWERAAPKDYPFPA